MKLKFAAGMRCSTTRLHFIVEAWGIPQKLGGEEGNAVWKRQAGMEINYLCENANDLDVWILIINLLFFSGISFVILQLGSGGG